MLAAYCPGHRTKVLVPLENITELRRVPDGFVVHFNCACGFQARHHEAQKAER